MYVSPRSVTFNHSWRVTGGERHDSGLGCLCSTTTALCKAEQSDTEECDLDVTIGRTSLPFLRG